MGYDDVNQRVNRRPKERSQPRERRNLALCHQRVISGPAVVGRREQAGNAGKKEQPMEKLAQNIQEAFLNNARKEKTFLTIYLMSGVKLSGRIKSFDKYSVILETNNQEQLIFKHAISTVVVSKPFHSTQGAHGTVSSAVPGVHPAPGSPVTEPADQ
jgi:host factor-I protein